MNVVIVESPAKAKTINKYLGSSYHVLASYGHVRDLPSKDGSVLPDEDFAMQWETDSKSVKRLNEIVKAVKGSDKLILATDPDREGEAISWHVLKVLEEKKALKGVEVERVVFNAVTKSAVMEAIDNPREIDGPLVNAYLARRALDYLVGFTLSPVLWRKLPGARSAGRVQSVALRLVCDREAEIEAFKSQEYWSIETELKTGSDALFPARLVQVGSEKLDRLSIGDEKTATIYKNGIESGTFQITSVESKDHKRNPSPPFTTSTLQQEASRKLGFSARQTMQVAQRLYEGVNIGGTTQGLITYMRTDGVQIAGEAIAAARNYIGGKYGDSYLPNSPRQYQTKAKNAQEAHEAIRPVEMARTPEEVSSYLESDQAKLYKLIWRRTIASQMQSAQMERTTAQITVAGGDGVPYGLRATGTVVRFDGFLKLYEEGRDDTMSSSPDDRRLPILAANDPLSANKVEASQHFTEPPPRYTEATLIKKMEELGIGRPSTYASTLNVLGDREYVRFDKKRLIPEDKGRLVIAFLESFFQRYVEYDFTAGLEEKLDLISADTLQWKDVLRDFWKDFSAATLEIKDLRISEVLDALNDLLGPHIFPVVEEGVDPRKCPSCDEGKLSMKIGRFGAFIGCSNYPDCRFTRQFSEGGEKPSEAASPDGKALGNDPETGLAVTLRSGRFGPYVQLGETVKGEKPKRASIPKTYEVDQLDLEKALALLSLPREVGLHPETGKPISAGIGRYGPFVLHEGTYANLDGPEEVFTVGINRAVTLLAEKAKKGAGRGGSVIKDMGDHPSLGGKVQVMSGRYGPYVKHGKINATLPKSSAPEEMTMDEAVALIAAKAEKGGKKKPAARKSKPRKKKPDADVEATT